MSADQETTRHEAEENQQFDWRYAFTQRIRQNWRDIIAIPVIVMLAIALILSVINQDKLKNLIEHENDVNECQQEYNRINNSRTRILTEVNENEREANYLVDEAQRLLFTSPVLSVPADRRTDEQKLTLQVLFKNYQIALGEKQKRREATAKALKENPVPAPPEQICK